jgi:hypothetical protein
MASARRLAIKIALHLVTDVCGLAVVLFKPTRWVDAENLFLRRQLVAKSAAFSHGA